LVIFVALHFLRSPWCFAVFVDWLNVVSNPTAGITGPLRQPDAATRLVADKTAPEPDRREGATGDRKS
jgi:hypothetical protein